MALTLISTESALTFLDDTWLKAINIRNLVGCIFVDFCKMLDLVDHNLLSQKPRHCRLSELCLSWFDSYLCNRYQQVNTDENLFESDSVRYSVPQGSKN